MTAATVPGPAPATTSGKGVLIPLFGGLLLTFDVPLLKLSGADAWTMVFVRGILLCSALFVFWLAFYRLRGSSQPFVNGRTGWLVALLTGTANITFMSAIHETSVANVVFILAFNPMFTGLLSRIFLGERLHAFTWAAIVFSLVGVGVIVGGGLQAGTWFGDMLALVTAMQLATILTIIRKSGTDQSMSPALGHLGSALSAGLLAAPATLSTQGWFWLGLNGLLVMPAATALLMLGPRFVAAAVVAMFFLLETVLTPVWMWAIFAELPTPASFAGGAIVIATLFAHSVWSLTQGQPKAHA